MKEYLKSALPNDIISIYLEKKRRQDAEFIDKYKGDFKIDARKLEIKRNKQPKQKALR